jgi:hypothetical protein
MRRHVHCMQEKREQTCTGRANRKFYRVTSSPCRSASIYVLYLPPISYLISSLRLVCPLLKYFRIANQTSPSSPSSSPFPECYIRAISSMSLHLPPRDATDSSPNLIELISPRLKSCEWVRDSTIGYASAAWRSYPQVSSDQLC